MTTSVPDNTRLTLADVARIAGVSNATVSRVLNGNQSVAPALVARVQAALEETQYRPNPAGRALRRQRSDLLAAIIPDVRNPFFAALLDAFERMALTEGYSVVLCNTLENREREQAAIASVVAHKVSGVLMAATPRTSLAMLTPLADSGIPVITVDREVPRFTGDMVNVDNLMVGRVAARHILEQHGTSPLILSHIGRLSPLIGRERGFREQMAEAGHPVPDAHVIRVNFRDPQAPTVLADALSSMDLDSVFAVTNSLTADAYEGLRRSGRRIGPDVALIGVDDDRWNAIVEPAVTVVEQPAAQLGEWAGQLLAARAKGSSVTHARVLLDPSLTVRASSLRDLATPG